MNEAKEFLGKSLDAAIAEACKYYDSGREQLEIEIIEDAKSGIFGLVGARKAKIMARRAEIPDLINSRKNEKPKKDNRSKQNQKDQPEPENQAQKDQPSKENKKEDKQDQSPAHEDKAVQESAPKGRETKPSKGRRRDGDSTAKSEAAADPETQKNSGKSQSSTENKAQDGKRSSRSGQQSKKAQAGEAPEAREDSLEAELQDNGYPKVKLADLDQAKLEEVSRDIILRLSQPIAGEVEVKVNIGQDRIQLRLESEDSGLLIGREGQNLAAIQYLATRMISRAMDAQIKVQVDAGDYHSRQDIRLQEMAQNLAQKVRLSGRSMSTKPLSAYQRRVIHLTLQDDPDVQTRSSGDGALKRVVVMRRKDN